VPSVVRLWSFLVRGWVARVDGNDAQIFSDGDGAQMIPLEPGKHRVEVAFVSTPPRTAGSAITVLGFVIIFVLVAADYYRRRRSVADNPGEPFEQSAEA
jgi:hypothetical protein